MPKQNGMAIDIDVDENDHIKTFEGSNGLKMGGIFILEQMHLQQVCPNDTAINKLIEFNVKAGTMQENDTIQIKCKFSASNNANTKICSIRFGGVPFFSAGLSNWQSFIFKAEIHNRNSKTNQLCTQSNIANEEGNSANAFNILNIDTTKDQPISIHGQKTVSGDALCLESVIVKLLRGVN